ncbi:MAG TPA: hypothetical protein VFT19_05480 [Solirubrobacterales bacterium]|nr:hypothetical protein [Solirubrobacterales bacterium]
MADQNPTGSAERVTSPSEEDRKVEWAVLSFLLDRHPESPSIIEVSRALNEGTVEFEREDSVERAVRELVGAGLLRCDGSRVLPTRAALYFWQLDG